MKRAVIHIIVLLFFTSQFVHAQGLQITGQVNSAEQGTALAGVNVAVKGKPNSNTRTDNQGQFKINIQVGDVLIFSSVGYQSEEKSYRASGHYNIQLSSSSTTLDEVVLIGYGSMKKSDLTGAVTSVKSADLQKTPAAGVDQALQGRAAGVTVNANSGQPGAPAVVRIRGIGTVNDSSPIYVVDGVILSDISFLSPNDVSSTEILKDASATAIYGSRGANGVILISTKKGTAGQTNISVNAYTGIQNRWNKLDLP